MLKSLHLALAIGILMSSLMAHAGHPAQDKKVAQLYELYRGGRVPPLGLLTSGSWICAYYSAKVNSNFVYQYDMRFTAPETGGIVSSKSYYPEGDVEYIEYIWSRSGFVGYDVETDSYVSYREVRPGILVGEFYSYMDLGSEYPQSLTLPHKNVFGMMYAVCERYRP